MSVFKKLEDQLNCPICLETYINPKQLQCNHVYCQQCLVRLVDRDRQGHLTLTCPNCRYVQPVPVSGVVGLQPAFQINKFIEILAEHKMATIATKRAHVVCPEHGGKEMELYCETCGETICWECIMKGSKHHSHEYKKLNEHLEQYKNEITSSSKPLEKQLETIEKALKAFDARHEEISDQRATIETDIHNNITQLQVKLHKRLEVRETELLSQLDKLTQAKLKSLAVQRDQLETIQAQLNSCLLFMKENVNYREAVKQVKELTTTFQEYTLEPTTQADMIFSALTDFSAECHNYGKVYPVNTPAPSKCHVTCSDTAAVGEKCTAILQMMNIDDQPCKGLMTSISCDLVSEIAGTRARGNVERKGQNQYKISYQPTIKGRHQLHIRVKGQHIWGSPFPVRTKLPAETLGTPFHTIGGVNGAIGVVLNKREEVVVTEWSGHCITVFRPSGERLKSFGTCGFNPGQFQYPYGVAVDSEENILVTDCYNHRIQKFTTQGQFIVAVGNEGSGPLQFKYPKGIAVSASNGRVYVVDSNNSRVQILNSDFSYSGCFGKRGSGIRKFNNIEHIACDSTGNVYVADRCNHRIQVFTPDGEFLRMFGQGRGELEDPYGIAIDSSDRVYVSELGHGRVLVFTPEGQFVTSFGSEREGARQLDHPLGLAVDSSGVVYVCEQKQNIIKLF